MDMMETVATLASTRRFIRIASVANITLILISVLPGTGRLLQLALVRLHVAAAVGMFLFLWYVVSTVILIGALTRLANVKPRPASLFTEFVLVAAWCLIYLASLGTAVMVGLA